MFAGKKSAQIREILISESAWEEMTCLFAPSLKYPVAPGIIFNMIHLPFLSYRVLLISVLPSGHYQKSLIISELQVCDQTQLNK
ncbi:hypothetical protein FYK42_21740 [Escherichia coli]|nr:hypothetical protein FYK42_21740 [Escherichia coli]